MTGRYKAYPDYKDSVASWCGIVPSHWNDIKFKWILEEKKKVSNPVLPSGSISFGEVILKNEDSLAPETKASYQEVLVGELLINPLNLNFDLKSLRTALSTIDVVVSTGYIVAHIDKELNSNYMRWVMHQFDVSHMKTMGSGVRQTINFTDIANSAVCIAPYEEQQKIADFLDHETAKIDTLITKQEKLIELLKEKRQAVISHAVTKGLNPDAPMKDSGVEWLGEVPEHWVIKQIKHFFMLQRGHDLASTQFKQGPYPVYGSNGIIGYHSDYTTKAPSITVGRSGSVGEVNYVSNDFWAHNTSLFLKSSINGDIKFIYYFLLSMDLKSLAAGSAVGSLDRNNIHSRLMAIPSFEEQQSIVTYLEKQLNKFVLLTGKANDTVKLLKERKTALISAAVTGKIDVRDWQGEA